MITIIDARETYYELSGKASELCRQLAFAGIAVIWIFKIQDGVSIKIPDQLFFPLLLIILSLIFDFLQYVSGALIWGIYNLYKEKKIKKVDEKFNVSIFLNWPALAFFILKILYMVVGYIFLILYFLNIITK